MLILFKLSKLIVNEILYIDKFTILDKTYIVWNCGRYVCLSDDISRANYHNQRNIHTKRNTRKTSQSTHSLEIYNNARAS